MVESNQKVKNKVFKRYLFAGVDDLKQRLTDYLNHYNFEVKLRQLDYQTPAGYLKERFNHSIQRIVVKQLNILFGIILKDHMKRLITNHQLIIF